jgi:hypothetical protein
MEKKEEIKKEEQLRYERTQVPETYKLVISDNKEKVLMEDLMEILTTILNKIERVEKSVA